MVTTYATIKKDDRYCDFMLLSFCDVPTANRFIDDITSHLKLENGLEVSMYIEDNNAASYLTLQYYMPIYEFDDAILRLASMCHGDSLFNEFIDSIQF